MIFLGKHAPCRLAILRYPIIMKKLLSPPIGNYLNIITGLFLFLFLLQLNCNGQTVADFTLDDTLGCTPFTVTCTNTGSTGANYEHEWYFGSTGPISGEDQVYTFYSPGIQDIKLIVTNTSTSEKDSLTKEVTVILTPPASLTIDSTNACVHGIVEFTSNLVSRDSSHWIMGDGTIIRSMGTVRNMSYSYSAHGTYNVQHITYYGECSDTSKLYPIVVDGPIADFSFVPEAVCKGAPVEFTMTPDFDVTDFSWELGEGDVQTVNPATHVYDTIGYIGINLNISGSTGSCTLKDTLYIYEVIAEFDFSVPQCHQQPVTFTNTSMPANASWFWDLGNGNTSTAKSPVVTYVSGEYTIILSMENSQGCTDTLEKLLTVNELPTINISGNSVICPGEAAYLEVDGGDIVTWSPETGLDDPNSFEPLASPTGDSTLYTATITDTLTHCSNSDEVMVILQEGFITGRIFTFPADTSIIIGDTVVLHVYDTLARELSYQWTPDTWISCSDCSSPTVQPLETTTYTLIVSDTNQCFLSESFDFRIEVREEYRIGIPDAFTPNGDQINDIIKVDGWGIKRLLEFRIYNRWGNEVFATDDINTGWDGYYEGKLQMTGTYVYMIKAEMWDDQITTINGTFTLLR